jgi:hypothetical protein
MIENEEYHQDALSFASLLKKTKIPDKLWIGKFILVGVKSIIDRIQYNQADLDLLENAHEYTFPILAGDLQVSLQLYLNSANHYRLFCYTRIGGTQGMTFSVNLTTEKESENVIFLTQKIRFVEQYDGSSQQAQAHRRQKQVVFGELLRKLGYELTENNDLILGIYDPTQKKLVNTSPHKFLNDFLVVSLLKGHFQGIKGYQLEILPNFNQLGDRCNSPAEELVSLPAKVVKNKTKRAIPLAMRYKVLKKDGFTCVACGHGVADGAKLQVDHKLPFSLGGLTELSNLQTLCDACNLGKSNRFND